MSGTEEFAPVSSKGTTPGPSASPGTAPDPWLSAVVGQRYRIEARIGQGGMGVIYRGHHLELGKRVAVKRLDPRIASDKGSFERFRREAIAASHIESPHVVHVFDWGKADDGSPYLVMELLDGCDLRQLFAREGRLLPEQATTVIGQVLRALIHTHQARIIHRDLKPENIFLCRYDAHELYVKLLDFGISKQTSAEPNQPQVTRAGVILGTASYMSPEQAKGDISLDARSDLYSVGAILYEALTGRVPHYGRTYEATLFDICTRGADDVRLHAPLVSEVLAKVVARALERDPAQRFQSAREFLDALTNAVPNVSPLLFDSSSEGRAALSIDSANMHPPSGARAGAKARWRTRTAWLVAVSLGLGIAGWAVLGTNRDSVPSTLPSATFATSRAPLASTAAAILAPTEVPAPIPAPSTSGPPALAPTVAGGGSGRTPTHRGTINHAASSNPTDTPGVAAGLKLRRTMP